MQILVTIPILVTTLVRIETDVQAKVVADTNDPRVYLLDKVVRVRIENIWFILYEIWRLWIVTDGVTPCSCTHADCQASLTEAGVPHSAPSSPPRMIDYSL